MRNYKNSCMMGMEMMMCMASMGMMMCAQNQGSSPNLSA